MFLLVLISEPRDLPDHDLGRWLPPFRGRDGACGPPPQAKIPDYQRGYTVLTDHAPDILSDQCGGHTGQLVASERDLNDMANAWNTIVQSALRQSRSKCA